VAELAMMARTNRGETASRDATTFALTAATLSGVVLAVVVANQAEDLVLPGAGWWPLAAGLTLVVAGFALRVWAVHTLGRFFKYRVVVQEGHEVVETGPYARVRHPSYTGMIICSAGVGLMLGNWLAILAAALPTLIGFTLRLLSEERTLAAELGDPYREYMTRTKRLVPGVWCAALLAGLAILPGSDAAAAEPSGKGDGIRLNRLARFDQPTFVGAPEGAGSLVYVVERRGVIRLLEGEHKRGEFLDMRRWVDCCDYEKGLLSVAFSPHYERNRRFYVYFTNNQGNIEIDEFKRSKRRPRRAGRGTRRKVIEIPQSGPINHNGGQVAFGPDGFLYTATGDGGRFDDPSNLSQKRGSLLGKLLRIDPRRANGRPYRSPASNPYKGRRGEDEIYARGLRNPWRFSFAGDRILIADVGQSRREEVSAETVENARKANFGWNRFEGTLRFRPGHIEHHDRPIHQYSHSAGACSITGGYVVRDPRLPAGLRGRYVYGDYCTGEIRSFLPGRRRGRDDRGTALPDRPGLASFGVDDRRRVYVAVIGSGVVARIDPG
jgi:protein-S-isoprenylcysteine O-methyltransferase Ste14